MIQSSDVVFVLLGFSTLYTMFLVKQWSYNCIVCDVSANVALCQSASTCCSLSHHSSPTRLSCSIFFFFLLFFFPKPRKKKEVLSIDLCNKLWNVYLNTFSDTETVTKPECVLANVLYPLNVNQMECKCICMSKVTFPATKRNKSPNV